ncbi:hypothetical protein KP509_22G075300 [Ceratopteris richardii]|uniref:Uncharacterized protein n=1 Tax=Ceratopteris richardii TaxID=49495 RepID=A0A8T2S966_CERRI|nr:hypothetical protein KP509_22G075300 [Ceratopteris richardii]
MGDSREMSCVPACEDDEMFNRSLRRDLCYGADLRKRAHGEENWRSPVQKNGDDEVEAAEKGSEVVELCDAVARLVIILCFSAVGGWAIQQALSLDYDTTMSPLG